MLNSDELAELLALAARHDPQALSDGGQLGNLMKDLAPKLPASLVAACTDAARGRLGDYLQGQEGKTSVEVTDGFARESGSRNDWALATVVSAYSQVLGIPLQPTLAVVAPAPAHVDIEPFSDSYLDEPRIRRPWVKRKKRIALAVGVGTLVAAGVVVGAVVATSSGPARLTAPTQLQVRTVQNDDFLTWSAVPHADHYLVAVDSGAADLFTPLPQFENAMANGKSHTYRVYAVRGNQIAGPSPQVTSSP